MTAEPKPTLQQIREDIEARLNKLKAQVPQVRTDLNNLRGQMEPIVEARRICLSFVNGTHLQLEQLVAQAKEESARQAEIIVGISSDLNRCMEMAELFVSARAESWLHIEATVVGPADSWTTTAAACSGQFDHRIAALGEWISLKRPRWLPDAMPAPDNPT